jgi:transcriptional regulator with XRE-family HTH domain
VVGASAKSFQPVSDRLKRLREAFGETQKEWSERHGFHYKQYNNWECGLARIPVEHAITLCDRYGITLDFIYRGRLDGLPATARKLL